MATLTVKDPWIKLLNYNINGSAPIKAANSLVLPQGSTVTVVKQATNNHGIPFVYFTVNNIKAIQVKGKVSGTVQAKTQYVSPLKHFASNRSANGMHSAGGSSLEKEYGKTIHADA